MRLAAAVSELVVRDGFAARLTTFDLRDFCDCDFCGFCDFLAVLRAVVLGWIRADLLLDCTLRLDVDFLVVFLTGFLFRIRLLVRLGLDGVRAVFLALGRALELARVFLLADRALFLADCLVNNSPS